MRCSEEPGNQRRDAYPGIRAFFELIILAK